MSAQRCRRLLPAACIACSMPVAAEAPGPLDASAAVAPPVHESAFAAYRRPADAGPGDWKAANERVGRIGGWRAYAREAQAPAARPAGPAASAAPASEAARHDGHGRPGKGAP